MMEEKGAYTLAIGDGGNDVNMIQSATIGVGVMGQEGAQASQFADYSIPEFRCLHRLLLIHGRGFGKKITQFVGLCMFKNLNYMMVSYIGNLNNGFSGIPSFDLFYWSLYNVMNTNFPIILWMYYDWDYTIETDWSKRVAKRGA